MIVLIIVILYYCVCFSDCREMELESNAMDDDVADKLWNRSFELCDIPIPQWSHWNYSNYIVIYIQLYSERYLLVHYFKLLYLWSKCAAVIGSNLVTWCKLIWGIDRFTAVTGQYVDWRIDRSTYWPVRMVFLKTGLNHSVKKLKSHFLTVRVCIWSKCQMIRIN